MQVKCNFLRANKLNANPPKATFYCKLECFLHLRTCLKTPQKSANQNLELSPPPTPPQQNLPGSNSKRYSSLSVITISNFQPPPTPPQQNLPGRNSKRYSSLSVISLAPPTPPFPFGNTSKRYSAFRHLFSPNRGCALRAKNGTWRGLGALNRAGRHWWGRVVVSRSAKGAVGGACVLEMRNMTAR